jgi:hypothetical protein
LEHGDKSKRAVKNLEDVKQKLSEGGNPPISIGFNPIDKESNK